MFLVDHKTIKCGYLSDSESSLKTVFTGSASRISFDQNHMWIYSAAGGLISDEGKTVFSSGVSGDVTWDYDQALKNERFCVLVNHSKRCWLGGTDPSRADILASDVQEEYLSYNHCYLHTDKTVSCEGSNSFGESDPLDYQKDRTLLPIAEP